MNSHWCFTLNNPTDKIAWNEKIRYAVYQKERGESGTEHYQGYVEFNRNQRFAACKKLLPTAHWEPRKGSRNQARDYAMKEDTRIEGPWEFGEWRSKGQGNRKDMQEVQQMLKDGASLKEVAENHFGLYCRYEKSFQRYKELVRPNPHKPRYDPSSFTKPLESLDKPLVIIGGSGIGKSQYALAHFKNPLLVSQIDDLQQLSKEHDGIVFDDMSFSHYPATAVIHIVDKEMTRTIHNRYKDAEIPEGTNRIFTHNSPIEDWLIPKGTPLEQMDAIKRRINVIEIKSTLINK